MVQAGCKHRTAGRSVSRGTSGSRALGRAQAAQERLLNLHSNKRLQDGSTGTALAIKPACCSARSLRVTALSPAGTNAACVWIHPANQGEEPLGEKPTNPNRTGWIIPHIRHPNPPILLGFVDVSCPRFQPATEHLLTSVFINGTLTSNAERCASGKINLVKARTWATTAGKCWNGLLSDNVCSARATHSLLQDLFAPQSGERLNWEQVRMPARKKTEKCCRCDT